MIAFVSGECPEFVLFSLPNPKFFQFSNPPVFQSQLLLEPRRASRRPGPFRSKRGPLESVLGPSKLRS